MLLRIIGAQTAPSASRQLGQDYPASSRGQVSGIAHVQQKPTSSLYNILSAGSDNVALTDACWGARTEAMQRTSQHKR